MRGISPLLLLAGLVALLPARAAGQEFVPHRLYVTDVYRKNVMVFESNGDFLGTLIEEPVFAPVGIAFGPGGELFVTTSGAEAILPLDPQGQLAGPPISSGGLVSGAGGLAFGPNGRYFLGSVGTGEIFVIAPDGIVEDLLPLPRTAAPMGLGFAPNGDLWVAAFAEDRVYELCPSGGIVRTLESPGLSGPLGVAAGPDARIYVSGFFSDAVFAFAADGSLAATLSSENLDGPTGLAFGPDGNLYVGALETHRVLVFRTDGALVREILAPLLLGPQMLAFSPVRLDAKVAGLLSEPGVPPRKIREKFKGGSGPRFSLFPGLGQVMLHLEDGDDPEDLASLLGTDRLVFFAAAAPAKGSTSLWLGDQTASLTQPSGHVDLAVKGKEDPATGILEPKSAKGILSVRSGVRLLQAKVGGKRADP